MATLDRLAAELVEEPAQRVIRDELPTPLSQMYFDIVNRREKYAVSDGCLKLFEATMRYVGLVAFARLLHFGEVSDSLRPIIVSGLLRKPALGGWVGLLRHLDFALKPHRRNVFGCSLDEKRSDLPNLLKLTNRITNRNVTSIRLLDVLDSFTLLRNQAAHRLSQVPLGDMADSIVAALEEFFTVIPVLREGSVVHARQVTLERRRRRADLVQFRGAVPVRSDAVIDGEHSLHGGDVYLQEHPTYLRLSPFIIEIGGELLLFSYLQDRTPIYESPTSSLTANDTADYAADIFDAAPFLAEKMIGLEALMPVIEGAAADGVVNARELAYLHQRAIELGLAQSKKNAEQIVDMALGLYAPLATILRDENTI